MSFGNKKSVKDLRRFGFAFGTAMTILGSLLLWRDRAAWPWVLGLAATVFLGLTAGCAVCPGGWRWRR